MNMENEKCVLIMDEHLPIGVIANTAVILGITLGTKMPDVVGDDVPDFDGNPHAGIIRFPVPVLKGNKEILKVLRIMLLDAQFDDLTVVDFSDLAQKCRTYDEFIDQMAAASEAELHYIGIAICGNKKKINKLTGNLPLLR